MAVTTLPEEPIHDTHHVDAHHADAHHDDAHSHELPPDVMLKANRLGLWLFCISEIFLFGGLLAARFYLWRSPLDGSLIRPELSQTIGLITTIMLLVSSYFMVRAEVAIGHNDMKKFFNSLRVTFVMGLIFLLGVVIVEWGTIPSIAKALTGHEHLLRPWDNGPLGGVFFAMTGMHAIHVLTGLIFIAIVYFNGKRGLYDAETHWGVEACAIYWHYVDVVWIFFYPALYLIGEVFH